jgi:excisionase family DNA binding protein
MQIDGGDASAGQSRTTPFGAPVARPSRGREPWLTPADVAARLKLSRATVYGLIRSGALHHRRVGLQIRVTSADVDALPTRR